MSQRVDHQQKEPIEEEAQPLEPKLTRRSFLAHAGLASAALGSGLGCDRRAQTPANAGPARPARRALDASLPTDAATSADGASAAEASPEAGTTPADWQPFPVIEASGSPEELGAAVGRQTEGLIRGAMAEQREWLERLRRFAFENREVRFTPFLNATEQHHPAVFAELRGMARGANIPLDDLWLWNLQPELGTMLSQEPRAGCSTLHLASGGRLLIAHNEDGNAAFRRRMAILRLRPEGKPAFTCLHYPGQIPGQVPAWNEAGLVVTTNFIATLMVRPGIPRYVLGRAVHGCSTIAEAVRVATHSERAFAFTLHLGSVRERRLACLEVAPETHELNRTTGLFFHTNHLVLRRTRDVPQRSVNLQSSSGSRLHVLRTAAEPLGQPQRLTNAQLITLLSSHRSVREPFSPCRHAGESSQTQTLATVLMDIRAQTFSLFEGNPCENRRRELELMT